MSSHVRRAFTVVALLVASSIAPSGDASPPVEAPPIVYHGDRSSPRVALTFDDGWDPDLVKKALDVAKKKEVRLTFFPVGMRVVIQKPLWKRAVAEGHELGNHSFFHRRFTEITPWEMVKEVRAEEQAIDGALGEHHPLAWLRPPDGDGGYFGGDPDVLKVAKKLGYVVLMWDVETSKLATSKQAASYVTKKVQNGSIVLLHLGPRDVGALGAIVDGVRALGLEPTTVSDLLGAK